MKIQYFQNNITLSLVGSSPCNASEEPLHEDDNAERGLRG